MTGGWGEGEAAGAGTSVPSGKILLGKGVSMRINPEQWRALLQRPDVAEATIKRAQQACDTANSLAITEGAEYIVSVHSDGSCSVHPGGADPIKGIVDDAYHSTLLKAQVQDMQ